MQVLSPTEAIKDATKQQLSKQGRHLWRGVYSVVAGAGPAHAVHFAAYEFCKEKLNKRLANYHDTKIVKTPVSSLEISNQLIASGTAGAIATFAHDFMMTPFDGK